ncbi:MAG: regulator of sirC expression with transglutaminase-like and TPR domain [Alteromonadaceae bacterium]|jgi:regulator of sirC expression with transglutaminase-like and TPR domain
MSEIKLSPGVLNTSDLLTDILLFEQKWDSSVDLHHTMALVNDIIVNAKQAVQSGPNCDMALANPTIAESPEPASLTDLNCLLDYFYLDLAFSSTPQSIDESLLNSLAYLIKYHTGESLSMVILLNHVILSCGFDCSLAVVDHEIMLRVNISEHEFVLVDSLCGEVQRCPIVDKLTVLPSIGDIECRILDRMSLLQIYLTQQKLAFTDESKYADALCCIELLIKTMPDDPYQRRDRGFLLHQLDCFKVARDDFEFFIEQCPQDPAAQLLKLQLEEFDGSEQTVH